jgi:hypothetical protein
MEAIRSSETSVHTRSTQRHIPEDGILLSHRSENLKFLELHTCYRYSKRSPSIDNPDFLVTRNEIHTRNSWR